MTKFIKVTECNGNMLLLNADRIENVCLGAKGTDTYVKLLKTGESKENYFFVKESVEAIWNMLTFDNTKAPIIMDAKEFEKYREANLRHDKYKADLIAQT